MKLPTILYRCPGPIKNSKGILYDFIGAADEAAFAVGLGKGYFATLDEAVEAAGKAAHAPARVVKHHKHNEKKRKSSAAPAKVEPAKAEVAKIDEISPPTRSELEQKARELGIRGVHLMKDETLANRISGALGG